jgi:hypothetical protein
LTKKQPFFILAPMGAISFSSFVSFLKRDKTGKDKEDSGTHVPK